MARQKRVFVATIHLAYEDDAHCCYIASFFFQAPIASGTFVLSEFRREAGQ